MLGGTRTAGVTGSRLLRGVILIAVSFAVSCGGKPAPPLVLEGTIVVGKDVNPDASGRPSPLFLRVYQLRGADALQGASWQDLDRNEAQVLAADLLKRETWEFCPPQTSGASGSGAEQQSGPHCHSRDLPIKITLEPEARFLGVVAEFYDVRDPKGRWREVREIPPPDKRFLRSDRKPSVVIKLERTTVSLSFE